MAAGDTTQGTRRPDGMMPHELRPGEYSLHATIRDITGCARCHGDGHEQITFTPLTHPYVEDSGLVMTHWAPCPTNGEPILLGTRG